MSELIHYVKGFFKIKEFENKTHDPMKDEIKEKEVKNEENLSNSTSAFACDSRNGGGNEH